MVVYDVNGKALKVGTTNLRRWRKIFVHMVYNQVPYTMKT